MRDRQHERNPAHPKSTELTTADERDLFSACFEHSEIGLLVTDLDARILQANSAYVALTGHTEQEIDLKTIIHRRDLPNALEKIRSLIAGEISAFVVEHRYVKKDGSTAWVQNSV